MSDLPPEPAFIVRPAQPDDSPACARVRVDAWRVAYKGLMPADFLAKMSYEKAEKAWRDMLWDKAFPGVFGLVAEVKGEVVGVLSGGPERNGDALYQGEVYVLYIHPDFHRRGIGRSLFGSALRRLREDGYSSLLVWVLEDNPWRPFYDVMGGAPIRSQRLEIGGVTLTEVGYGWGDISACLARLARMSAHL